MARNGPPVNTDDVLYIAADYSDETFPTLIESAANHFKMEEADVMENVSISVERIQESGCACCYDSWDWHTYIVLGRK